MREHVLEIVDKVIAKFKELRRVEVLKKGNWIRCELSDLKKGNVFRMFESDGTPVAGGKQFTALSDPYVDNGIWTIKVDYEEEKTHA